MSNPRLISSSILPSDKISDFDFQAMKAFDQATGREIAVFQRLDGADDNGLTVWMWKAPGVTRFVRCDQELTYQLESLYIAYLGRKIVE